MPHIGIAHATKLASEPFQNAFASFWPEAVVSNIADYSLPAARAAAGSETPAIRKKLTALAEQAFEADVDALLFAFNGFSDSIAEVARRLPIPVLNLNEAMFREAIATGGTVGMVGTYAPNIEAMAREYSEIAHVMNGDPTIQTVCADGAMASALSGNSWKHDQLIAEAAASLNDCDVIMLAQCSMAQSVGAIEELTGIAPLTSASSSVKMLRFLVDEQDRESSLQAL